MNAGLVAVENALYDECFDVEYLHGSRLQSLCEQYLRSRAGIRWRLELTGENRSYVSSFSETVRLAAAHHFASGHRHGIEDAVGTVCYALAHETAHARHTPLAATRELNRQLQAAGMHDPLLETALTWLWNTVEDGRVEQAEGRENASVRALFHAFRDRLLTSLANTDDDTEMLRLAVAYRARGGLRPLELPWPVEVCLVECDAPLAQSLAGHNTDLAPLQRMLTAIESRSLLPDVDYYRRPLAYR